MKQTIYINNQRIQLDAAQLIQAGGEGMVFDMGKTAVKLYHSPTKLHEKKLMQLLNFKLPQNVLSPSQLVFNKKNQLIGFQMPKLPTGSQPLKQLSNPGFWKKNGIQTEAVAALLHKIWQTLTHLHQNKIIVGDLNDTNLFFTHAPTLAAAPSWVDVDSYQFGPFPCPVAMASNPIRRARCNRPPNFRYVLQFTQGLGVSPER